MTPFLTLCCFSAITVQTCFFVKQTCFIYTTRHGSREIEADVSFKNVQRREFGEGVRRHEEKMFYQAIGYMHFTQKETELIAAGYAILRIFADLTRFSEKLPDTATIPEN